MKTKHTFLLSSQKALLLSLGSFAAPWVVQGAGFFADSQGVDALHLVDHEVRVDITESMARTMTRQSFRNTSSQDLEAVFVLPLPEGAVLSEMHVIRGDNRQSGEVVEKTRGETLYEEHANSGEAAGLATQDGFQRFEFSIYPLQALSETVLEFVYYQTLEVESGVGVYRYPLEENGTDDSTPAFWQPENQLVGSLQFEATVRSAWPLKDLRVPGMEGGQVETLENGALRFHHATQATRLDQDIVMYYRLEDNLPGRVDILAYKESVDQPGTFMAVVTPGMDLKVLPGVDTVFVLDISGSMETKLGMLIAGVEGAIQRLRPEDRYRIILFSNTVSELTRGWTPATETHVRNTLGQLKRVRVEGGTNLYAGIRAALEGLDSDRATNMILVTDGVANVGMVQGADFRKLLERYDLRLFSFVMGNGANWPLMEKIGKATGGYARGVSNSQDMIGEILLAQGKVTRQALHRARVHFDGSARPFDLTGTEVGKLFHGEQILLMGRYLHGGELDFALKGRLTGEDKTYATSVQLPDVDTHYPELERIWALHRLKGLDTSGNGEAAESALSLALEYQFVTEQTAMIVLDDLAFQKAGIERRNEEKIQKERLAQQQRPAVPQTTPSNSSRPPFPKSSPSMGGGAFGLEWILIGLFGLGLGRVFTSKKDN